MKTIPSLRLSLSCTALAAALLLPACDQPKPAATPAPAPSAPADAAPARTAPAPAAPAGELKVDHVDPAAAAKLLETDKTITVLDVRSPAEFGGGHIAGAKNVDFNGDDFAAALAPLDKNATYLVHCRSGGRSTASLETFKKAGFQHVIHMDGGLGAWQSAGLPVEK